FQGAKDDLWAARNATSLPVLRKDFMIDPYQIVQSRALGADCILIIMASVSDAQAADLDAAARALGMDVLVEVHDAAELDRALRLTPGLLGINNRNLHDFSVTLETTRTLAPRVPAPWRVVSESGLYTHADLAGLAPLGVRAFLVGESLMRQPDVAAATRTLLGGAP
ncbi:MAG: indole-3-glycerol phosphate synthase TrpC, partial [Gemmobacter sp.]